MRFLALTLMTCLLAVLGSAGHGNGVHEFSAPTPQASAQQPQLAVAADGTLYLVYGVDHTIYCAVSSDGGKHFSAPVAVSARGILSLGMHRGPRVAAAGRAVIVTAILGEQGKGRDGNLLAWRSTDHGKSWSTAATLNDVADAAREGLHSMAAGPGGLVFVTWLDLRKESSSEAGMKLYGVVSMDEGNTWGPNLLAYRSPDGSICNCCHPSTMIDSKGTIHVMWRNALAGSRDLYHLRSSDGGKTFTSAQKFGHGTWALNSCPMDGGELTVNSKGEVVSVWRREDRIYMSTLDAEEVLVGHGKNPVIAYGKKGRYLAWEDAAAKNVMLLSPNQTEPRSLGTQSRYVDLAVASNGSVAAAWEEASGQNGNKKIIKVQMLE
jgi:BNR repeat-like domain